MLYNSYGDSMKKKRRIKKKVIILILLFISIIIIFLLINNKDNINSKLKNIGYSNSEINELKNLTDEELNIILKNDYNNSLINIIKEKNYDKNKLNLYLEYINKYKDINYLTIFNLINEDNIDLLNQKYFIEDYIDRYIDYYNKNKNLTFTDVVSHVNSNIDYEYYTDSKASDTSKGMYTLVNKYNYLTSDYKSIDIITISNEFTRDTAKLNKTAYENFEKMAKDMKKEGLTIKITTGYRDYNFQATLYNNYVKNDGVSLADTYSARPGYSEHQLGFSVDLTNGNNVSFDNFKYTSEYKWLKDNAHKYGFIMRFKEDKENLTGYKFESWHYRYVGVDIATYIYENDITYEEYYAYFLR